MDVTCPKCRAIVEETIPQAFGETPYALRELDVLVPANMNELLERLDSRGAALEELPVAFVDMRGLAADPDAPPVILQGFEGIERGVWILATTGGAGGAGGGSGGAATGAAAATDGASDRDVAAGGDAVGEVSGALTVGAIIGAGLLDGINPCAFSTMLFLISMLAVAGRTRREILIIGIVYSLTVFVGYVLAGFGLFAGVRSLMVFPTLVAIMRWTLFGLLLVLAALSVRDAVLAGQGRTSEMTLQLPDKFKRRVHSVVRSGTRSASLVGGTVLLGIGVTIFEFSCTGQVYVPVIMHLARTGSGSAVGLLLLYNLAFILPLLIVFALAYAGVSMKKLGTAFGDRLVLVKLGLAAVFIGFAVLTVVV
jgi:cytochrome c biogenesis protein CcdA